MVTGASGVVGRAVVKAMLATDEVRATVRRADAAEPLRGLGAKVDGAGRRAGRRARRGAAALPHARAPRRWCRAARSRGALLRRTTGRSWSRSRRRRPPARGGSSSCPCREPTRIDQHPFLRAKGMAERSLAGSGLDYAILRCTHAYGLGGLWFTATVHGALATPPFVVRAGDPRARAGARRRHRCRGGGDGRPGGSARGHLGARGTRRPDRRSLRRRCFATTTSPRPMRTARRPPQRSPTVLGTPIDAVTASFFGCPAGRTRPTRRRPSGCDAPV